MELFLDDQPIPVTESNDVTICEVINRISDDLRESNRVVAEVVVDDVQCGDWEREPFGEYKIQEVSCMRLISEEPRRLAIKTLYDIAKYMPHIKNQLVETSSLIQSRREGEAMQLLEKVTSIWLDLYQGLKGAATVIGINQDEVRVGNTTAEAIHQDILQLLEDASNHLEEERFLELSDLLEYELAPKMPMVEEAIYVMIREAERLPH